LQPSFAKQLHSSGEDNAAIIVEYIAVMKSEVNLSDHYKKDLIDLLSKFSKYNDNKNKLFKQLTWTNIIAFLETLRRTETQDPMHKWIGTYSIYRMHLPQFFKWL
jgi:adenine C2-methylase RlmN of 23S rRNA A2503 and tRNA A37